MLDQLKQMKELTKLLGNVGDLKEKAMRMRDELEAKTVEGESGAGVVRVVMNGKFEVQSVRIDRAMTRSLMQGAEASDQDHAMVEDLVAGAVNDAVAKAQALVGEQLGGLTGGLDLPGLDGLMG